MAKCIVGFTGTRHGMTDAQRRSVRFVLTDTAIPSLFLHGGCRGADVQAARMVRELVCGAEIACHPGPADDPHQEDSGVDDWKAPPKTHFARNRDIVDACDVLVAAPFEAEEQPRGGTWYTVGYARKKGKPILIVRLDGSLLLANGKEPEADRG